MQDPPGIMVAQYNSFWGFYGCYVLDHGYVLIAKVAHKKDKVRVEVFEGCCICC
jgi:hypothetical protein